MEGVLCMSDHDSRGIARIDWMLLALLLLLVAPLRIWLIHNTEVTARDGIGYIRSALMFDRKSVYDTLKENHQHPGYYSLVWAVSVPIRAWQGETPDSMVLSAQSVNFIASLVLMFPMYFLGRQFFRRRISFAATLLYQYLPISAHHLSDAISEPVYLVFLVSAILQMVQTMRERSIARSTLCGLFTGLAYLTRPEGALVLLAVAASLCVGQMMPAWRVSWRRFVACGLATACVAIAVGCAYAIVIGGLSRKPTTSQALGREITQVVIPAADFLFAANFPQSDYRSIRFQRSITAIGMEVMQGLFYVGLLPALMGILAAFGRLRASLGFWAIAIYACIHTTILVMLAMSVSYVSDRHLMIIVILATYLLAAGIDAVPRWILSSSGEGIQTTWRRSPVVWSMLIAGVFLAACATKATQRLHGNRVGNHEAGLWLAKQVVDGDVILDDHAWSHYYSGLLFQEGREPTVPSGIQPTCYVVLTRSRDAEAAKDREGKQLAPDAQVVYRWPTNAEVAKARVVVYAQKRNFETHPWKKGP